MGGKTPTPKQQAARKQARREVIEDTTRTGNKEDKGGAWAGKGFTRRNEESKS